jgi:hypothetical protein
VIDDAELKDLEDVTQHPGWARVLDLAQREFGPAGARYISELERLLSVNTGDAQATQSLQVIIKARREIEGFFRGIEGRVKTLQERRVLPVNLSRRGPL